ncbi:PAS domain S-box protein [Rariglobus hedericola]|uniref:PAS domain S-box protein n=1 Tax=Rariglobus hedericola TaxID=2597822 RepID=A0A556QJ13_9BACT|nr:PAS domain S-box protein [Rariglobus hedericola]TSJ76612.1 PAS domain S-box protein [Rariglobus hedericola]
MSSHETPSTPVDDPTSPGEVTLPNWLSHGPDAASQLKLFFEHAPIGLSWREVDENGRPGKNIVNKRFCELIGLTPEQASNIDNVHKITHPDDWARQKALTAEIYAGKRNGFVLEKRYERPDGREVMCELTVVVLRNAEGRVTHHFAMLEDVSARHAAEQDLRRSESRWRTYLKIASEILFAITPEGTYKFVSDAWTPKLGHEVAEIIGHDYTEFIHPEELSLFRDFIAETLELGVSPRGIEYRVRHKDGHWVWHATTGSAYTDRDGRRAFFGVGRDVSIRRKAQEELKLALARREELEQIVNRSPSIVVLWLAEENWPVEYVSQSIRQFGYQPEDFTSRRLSFRGITHPDDRERVGAEVEAHAATNHHEYSQEYRIVCADGSVRWVDDHTVVRFDPEGNVTHHEGLITDITPRKDAEDRERALRERDLRLAGEVQHQLRPHVFPDIGEVEIEALSQASLHIGGDYYDVLPVDGRRWGFVIADVAGKGPAAALMMAACRATLRLCAAGEPSAATVVRRVNRALHGDMPPGMFISLFYGILDLDTNRLTYVRAGHEPALLLKAGGELELLSAGGLALGFDEGPVFDSLLEEAVLDLGPGDLLALYTDGITEAANASGDEFGRDRLVTTLVGQEETPLPRVVEKLNRYLRQFSALASRNDDRTLLLVRPR